MIEFKELWRDGSWRVLMSPGDRAAACLYVTSWSYCCDHPELDGYIDRNKVHLLGRFKEQTIDKLVSLGVWTPDSFGWRLSAWPDASTKDPDDWEFSPTSNGNRTLRLVRPKKPKAGGE